MAHTCSYYCQPPVHCYPVMTLPDVTRDDLKAHYLPLQPRIGFVWDIVEAHEADAVLMRAQFEAMPNAQARSLDNVHVFAFQQVSQHAHFYGFTKTWMLFLEKGVRS